MISLNDKTRIVRTVCEVLADGNRPKAAEIVRRDYPFTAPTRGKRPFDAVTAASVFYRDGFIDRYTGTQLVFPGAIGLLSRLLPAEFPVHPNWKMTECHVIYYELCPTVDHLEPVARGGLHIPDNWITTSMMTNSAKANWTVDELGWKVLPSGDLRVWDGMLQWLLDYIAREPGHLEDRYLRKWHGAARRLPGRESR